MPLSPDQRLLTLSLLASHWLYPEWWGWTKMSVLKSPMSGLLKGIVIFRTCDPTAQNESHWYSVTIQNATLFDLQVKNIYFEFSSKLGALEIFLFGNSTFNGQMWCFMTVSGILNGNCCNTVECETNFLTPISQNETLYSSQCDSFLRAGLHMTNSLNWIPKVEVQLSEWRVTIFFFLTTALSQWEFSHGKFRLPSLGKASCNRAMLPNLGCMQGVLVFP